MYIANERPREIKKEAIPNVKILAFDIETYSKIGTPDPKRDPIIIIAVATSDGDVKLFTVNEDKDDKKIIEEFVKYIQEYNPDIIVGYNSNRFDWIYLVERAKINKVRLIVDRKGGTPHPSVYGHQSISGRANIDLLDYAEGLYEVKVKTLKNVAEYLGVMSKKERIIIPQSEIADYWDDNTKRPLLLEYAKDDVVSTLKIAELALPFIVELSRLVGLTPDQILAASVGFRVEWYLMRQAFKENELVPNRIERAHETYPGALVFEPKKGLHKNVVYMDFASMYPSIIIKYNIGPDTYVPPYEEIDRNEVWICPEFGHRFRKEPPGLYKKALSKLLSARKEIREKMKSLQEGSVEYKLLNNRQLAIKVIANATYGYAGWTGARWYCKEAAEAITAWGRRTIMKAIEMAKSIGLEVLYGDTDSIFVKNDKEKVEKFIKMVEEELGFEIKVDKVYKRVFFTEAKKRYSGLLEDGRIDIVGFEAVRGDWADIAKDVQEKVIEIVLKEGSVDKAVEYVRSVIDELRNRKIPLHKLVIWKTLTKNIEEYEVEAPHVTAAKMLREMGVKVSVGDKVGYVICKGSGKISSRVKPYIAASYDDIDDNYYIERQIIPAALRILEYFGITETTLKTLAVKKQKSLFDFLKG